MKIFDAHVHVFPDKIAEKATNATGSYYGIPMYTVGTAENVKRELEKGKISGCLIHSTATKSAQVESVNDYIASLVKEDSRLVGFGSMHADYEKTDEEICRLKALSLKGIKLHTDFQGFAIDSEGAMKIYEAANREHLPVLFHVGDKKSTLSHPERLCRVAEKFPELTVIAAHLGGYSVWDEAKNLIGHKGNVYLDASSALEFMPAETAREIILRHGTDRVLFGSDFPMHDPEKTASLLLGLGLGDEDYEKIFYKNAQNLLGIRVAENNSYNRL